MNHVFSFVDRLLHIFSCIPPIISHRHLIIISFERLTQLCFTEQCMITRVMAVLLLLLYNLWLKYLLLILLNLPTIKHSFILEFLRIRARTIAISGALEFPFVRRATGDKITVMEFLWYLMTINCFQFIEHTSYCTL